MKVTVIDASKESQNRLLKSFSPEVDVQPITAAPFFDEKIEKTIEQFCPDLIILDLFILEDADSGFRILKQLKQSKSLKNIPLVVYSKLIGDNISDEYKKKALALGAAAALPKIPFPNSYDILRHARSKRKTIHAHTVIS